MLRTSDGVLHVSMDNEAGGALKIAHVSASGALNGRNTAVADWSGVTSDPDLVAVPGGGMKLVFGGHRASTTSGPYNEGYVYYASSDAGGATWTLGPNDAPAVKSTQGYASSAPQPSRSATGRW